MTCLQCVLCTVAVLFDGALAREFRGDGRFVRIRQPVVSADTRTFALTILAHLSRQLTFAVFADTTVPTYVRRVSWQFCAPRRVRAATSVCRPRREVMWACRAATAGSVSRSPSARSCCPGTCPRGAGRLRGGAAWYWDAHRVARRIPATTPPPTVWSVTLLTLLAGATWGAQFSVRMRPPPTEERRNHVARSSCGGLPSHSAPTNICPRVRVPKMRWKSVSRIPTASKPTAT